MKIELSISKEDNILEAVTGYDTIRAYRRINTMISGSATVYFLEHQIHDEGYVFAYATEFLIFLDALASGTEAQLTLRSESRAYAVSVNDGFDMFDADLFDADNNKRLDHIALADIRRLTESVEEFIRNALVHIDPALCGYYLDRKFL